MIESNSGIFKISIIKLVYVFLILGLISCDQSSKSSNKDDYLENSSTKIKVINSENFAFPNGKQKCLLMSFDDGPEHDLLLLEKLNEAKIVGTFHLNSGRLGDKAEWLSSELGYEVHFLNESQVKSVYNGHEVSGHGFTHSGLNNVNDSLIESQVSLDINKLNNLLQGTNHNLVESLAYPFGAYDDNTLEVLRNLDVKYARTTTSTGTFELPQSDFLTFDPTCHISEGIDYANYFVNMEKERMQVLHIWGHSYEFHENWEKADSLVDILDNNNQIWYAKSIELVEYLNAIENLVYNENTLYNPSEVLSIWVKNTQGQFKELQPGAKMDINFKGPYKTVNSIESLYPGKTTDIKYHAKWSRVHYKQRIEDFKNSPLDSNTIIFIGNSITEQGGNWSEKLNLKNVRNRGIAGDVTDGVLKRLDEIVYNRPKSIFLLIGINDLFNMHFVKDIPSEEYIADNIVKIAKYVNQKSPETKIYIQTILPTSKDYMVRKINKVNTIIKDNEKDSLYEIIDLHKVFADDNGLIMPNFTTDGTHLNDLGYAIWVKAIEKYLRD